MLGYHREELIGKTPIDLATDEFRQFMVAGRERILAMDYRRIEGQVVARDGRVVPVLIHGNTLRDDKGAQIGNIAFVTDLTEQKRALALAGQLQRNLTPRMAPDVAGFDIAGRSDVCEEVGGDYYDFLFGKEYATDKLKVVVGDISGHGVDAALLMTSARTFMRMRAARAGGPAQIVSSMNQHLSPDMEGTGHFMTLFFMEIDPATGTARWVRAGHDPALIYHPGDDRFEELMGTGVPLGVDRAFEYEEYALPRIGTGTIIALVTDGMWESVNIKGEMFGKKRLHRVIREHAKASSQKIVENVFAQLSAFTEGLPCQDDLTMVIIKAV
jgi:sigma-B regulation protein RsbU (phosphoserine phosphatase)